MSGGELLILLALALPLFAAAMIYAVGRMPDVRETLTLVACIGLAIVAISIFVRVGQGDPPALTLAEPLPGLAIAFRVEPLGALFAVMASVLWGVNSLFSIGYVRGRREARQTRFYICFALAMFGVMGIAFAANLFTLFLFYEALTFATYPLVTHAGTPAARRAGRIYLVTLVGASVLLFLPGIVGVKDATGDLGRPLNLKNRLGDDFCQLSGNDDTATAFLAQGGHGCISVTSNVAPALCAKMHDAWQTGNLKQMAEARDLLAPLHRALFCETSPGPVKYAASSLGFGTDEVRLPLVPATKAARAAVDEALAFAGLLSGGANATLRAHG